MMIRIDKCAKISERNYVSQFSNSTDVEAHEAWQPRDRQIRNLGLDISIRQRYVY